MIQCIYTYWERNCSRTGSQKRLIRSWRMSSTAASDAEEHPSTAVAVAAAPSRLSFVDVTVFTPAFFLFLQLLICLYNRHKIPRFYIKVKRDGSVGAIHLIINSSSADNCMYLDFYTTTIWTSFVSTLLSDAAQSSKTLDINRSSWPPYIDYCRPTPKSIIILIHDAGLFSSYSNLCWKVPSKNPTLLSFLKPLLAYTMARKRATQLRERNRSSGGCSVEQPEEAAIGSWLFRSEFHREQQRYILRVYWTDRSRHLTDPCYREEGKTLALGK